MSERIAAATHQHPNIPVPSIWKDIHSLTSDAHSSLSDFDQKYAKQMEDLKGVVKEWLLDEIYDIPKKISFFNLIEKLGVSYHFKPELELQLKQIFESHIDGHDYDLHTTSLLFRILRQHGYKISTGHLKKFMDNKKSMVGDVKGMLSLYEATFLGVHGEEDIIEEALAFSQSYLKSMAEKSSPHLRKHITNALELPLHKSMPRLEALKFISFYEQEESKNETLLLFAKLDFIRVQALHCQEINKLSRWWKELDWAWRLPHVRDRLMEAYLWTVMLYYEPCYSRARIMLCKITMLLTLIDDTYDSYATYEELLLLTQAMRRWDRSAGDDLPENMRTIYTTFIDEFDRITDDLAFEEKSYKICYVKEGIKNMCEAYFAEAEWSHKKEVPSFSEYLRNGIASAGSLGFAVSTYLGIDEEIADGNAFEWLFTQPKIVGAVYSISRLKNDITGHKHRDGRDHVLCSVECLKKEGLSIEEINELITSAWKDVNEECMKTSSVSMEILHHVVINLGRSNEVVYKDGDGYTCPEKLEDIITALFIHKIDI